MKYSILALVAFLIPPPAMLVAGCDETVTQPRATILPAEAKCHPWPGCTSWTGDDTVRMKSPKLAAIKQKRDSADLLVGDFDLTTSGEFARIHLEEGKIYRVEFSSRSGTLHIRPRRSQDQAALPLTIEDVPRASGTRSIEIAPRVDAEYELRVSGVTGFGAQVQVYREARPSQRWQRIASRHR